MSEMSRSKPWFENFWLDFLGVFLVFFCYGASRVPDVNEVHYWTKAARFWDPSFAPNDLFLDSGNAHWAFYFFFGSLTLAFELEPAVWVGRLVTWVALSVGWTSFCRSFVVFNVTYTTKTNNSERDSNHSTKPWSSTLASGIPATLIAGLWLVGMEWGLWAGEWVVGGCESKGIAYAFFFGGLASLARSRPLLGWSLIGLGNWFHVISGLWVSLTAFFAILLVQTAWHGKSIRQSIREHILGLSLCSLGFLAGAVPAVLMDLGTPKDQATLSAMEQVYNRLGHHLSPIKFSETRWRGFTYLVLATFSLLLISRQATWHTSSHLLNDRKTFRWFRESPFAFQFLSMVCVAAFALSMVGLLFDLVFSNFAPQFASSILRFYWFRWNDVTLPIMAAVLLYLIATGRLNLNPPNHLVVRRTLAAIGGVLVCGLLFSRYQKNVEADIPAGEKQSFSLKTDSRETRLKQYEDWKAVCRWIDGNTDRTGLWLTPRRQQSFKWRTRRPELAVWKDMPQNAKAVVEWSARINDAYKFDKRKRLQPMSPEEIQGLVNKYQIRYVLLDLRVEGQSVPADKIIYPNLPESNASFAVLQYEPATMETPP